MKTKSGARVFVYIMEQDDPKKCTSAKLVRFNLAKPIRSRSAIPRRAIVLNPSANSILLHTDRDNIQIGGLVAVDCSWNKVTDVFTSRFPAFNKRLPLLLAGNPVSYGRIGRLSSVEALGASLIITGFSEFGNELLNIFKWGQTFLTLNHDPLLDYSQARDLNEIIEIERSYFSLSKTIEGEIKNQD